MDMEKKDNNTNFNCFIKQQMEILKSFSDVKNVITSVREPEELFRFFNDHFDEFHQKENFGIVLAFVHQCIKVWIRRGLYLKYEIGELLIDFLDAHIDNENDKNVGVQIVYQFLNSFSLHECDDLVISERVSTFSYVYTHL